MTEAETVTIALSDLQALLRAVFDIEHQRNVINLTDEQKQALISALVNAALPVAFRVGEALGKTQEETKEYFGVYL